MNLLKATTVMVLLAVPAGAQTAGNPAATGPSAPKLGAGMAGQPGSTNGPVARSGRDRSVSFAAEQLNHFAAGFQQNTWQTRWPRADQR